MEKSRLETLADELLADELKDKRSYKSRAYEYNILSDSQLRRIRGREIPVSSLSLRQRILTKVSDSDL